MPSSSTASSFNPNVSRPKWMQYGGFYRSINEFDRPWVASPLVCSPLPIPNATVFEVELRTSPQSQEGKPAVLPNVASSLTDHGGSVNGSGGGGSLKPVRRRSTFRKRVGKVLGWLVSSSDERHEAHSVVGSDHASSASKMGKRPWRVQPNEWKEWGYYARPTIKGVRVRNTLSPPRYPEPSHVLQLIEETDLNPEQVFNSLLSPNDTEHPERWKLGIQHPSLPPRPTRWEPPDPSKPLPFPWECQLNPLLEHVLFGVPRMWWDIREDITSAQFGVEEDRLARSLSPADLAQPATWPFLTHMYINALAEDMSPKFAWPFMVLNEHGIKCRDVINSVYENFREYVFEEEYYGWTMTRRKEAAKAHAWRCDPAEHAFKAMWGEINPDDHMRRIDYLVGRSLFRGLEPNPDGSGWVLFLGHD